MPLVRGMRKGFREVRVSEDWATAGPNAKSWARVPGSVRWTGLRNPPGELAILLDPYMARPELNHIAWVRQVRAIIVRGPDRCQSLRCLPTVPIFPCPCRRDSVPVSAPSLPCLPGARRVRPGKGSALSLFCFLNATSPRGRPVRVSAQRLSLMWSRPCGISLLNPRQTGIELMRPPGRGGAAGHKQV